MERLLITGVDFPLGANLALVLAEHFEVLGLCDRVHVECPAFHTALCHADDLEQAGQLARDFRPRWLIHCGLAAVGSWDKPADISEGSRAGADAVVAAHWARQAADLSARLTVISSDAVLDGPRMFHDEDAHATAAGTHAARARAVEQALQGTSALVVRTHAYGWSPVAAHIGFAERAWECLSRGGNVPVDGTHYATPILAADLADLLLRAYRARLDGLYHLSGAERTNAYRFVCELAAAAGLPLSVASAAASAGDSRACHAETSLSSQRARRTLEAATPLLRDGLRRFVDQQARGWHAQWRSARRLPTEMAA